MERDVARALGLSSVFASSPTLVAEPSYRQFLERLAAAAQDQGQVGVGVSGAAAIPLCVLPAYAFHVQCQQRHPPPQQQQQQQDQQQQSSRGSSSVREVGWVDEATAVLCVGEQMTAEAVYDSVQQLGAKVLQAARQHSMRQQEVAELVARVRAVLRLRHLAKDEQLSLADFKLPPATAAPAACCDSADEREAVALQAACGRLLEASAALQHVLDGASLRIAFANRVAADGAFVDIAHDFVI
ncbi:hypothetical protein QJQ45_030273 [Haematococcus lacustris]|nr:hypothetical protein QJQ45_030273 [Haematococcus lacustris]